MAVRMKDIADDLGLSVVTVSKVLNNHLDSGAATRARVLRRIKELNYQPSLHAQGLASGRTMMVGLIVRESSLISKTSPAAGPRLQLPRTKAAGLSG